MHTLQCFEVVDALTEAASIARVHELCCSITSKFGFDYFIYGSRTPTPLGPPHIFIISGYPAPWRERYTDQGYLFVDPTVIHCATSCLPLTWNRIQPAEEQKLIRNFLSESRDFGLKSGFSIPVHSGKGEAGMFSLASLSDHEKVQPLILHAMPFVHMLAAHIHEAVRRVAKIEEVCLGRVQLSERERECLQWSAAGKTSWETSTILGISQRTVKFHLNNVAGKLQASNARHAVARAIASRLIAVN